MIGLMGGNDRLCGEESKDLSLGVPCHGGDSVGMTMVHCSSEGYFTLEEVIWCFCSSQMDSGLIDS